MKKKKYNKALKLLYEAKELIYQRKQFIYRYERIDKPDSRMRILDSIIEIDNKMKKHLQIIAEWEPRMIKEDKIRKLQIGRQLIEDELARPKFSEKECRELQRLIAERTKAPECLP